MTVESTPSYDRRVNLGRRERFERLRRDLLTRLASVCASMPADETRELAATMVRIRLKYEMTGLQPDRAEGR